jgi:molybdopterin-guanine dinucleotide biosynthesis protein
LVEGFKECSVPQVAIVRGAMALPKAKQLIAIVSDRPKTQTAQRKSIRNFGFDEAEALANFLEKKFLR